MSEAPPRQGWTNCECLEQMLGFVEALGEEDVDDEDAAEDEAEEAAGGGHQQQDPLLQLHTATHQII